MVRKISEPGEKEAIAAAILHGLPDWFGIPEHTRTYLTGSREMPFWAAFLRGEPVGFAALRETSPHAAEVYVMGVRKDQHRRGVGRALYDALERFARENGYSFLQVKTVRMGHYEEYDRTNRFYIAMGFQELECFPTLWDPWNPCQIYIKAIAPAEGLQSEEGEP